MSSQNDVIAAPRPVIKCASVYKIFGENSKKMLQRSNGIVDAKTFQDAGCVVGVCECECARVYACSSAARTPSGALSAAGAAASK